MGEIVDFSSGDTVTTPIKSASPKKARQQRVRDQYKDAAFLTCYKRLQKFDREVMIAVMDTIRLANGIADEKAREEETSSVSIDDLPFVGPKRPPKLRDYWTVRGTGDYGEDCDAGVIFGEAAVKAAASDTILLGRVVLSMIENQASKGHVVGFMSAVSWALRGEEHPSHRSRSQ